MKNVFVLLNSILISMGLAFNAHAAPGVFYVKALDHNVRIHTYSAGPGLNNLNIIETPKSLILIDAMTLPEEAAVAQHYAQQLKKPIARVYVSHGHDHHNTGLEAFSGKPLYALPETIAILKKEGAGWVAALQKNAGSKAPKNMPIPTHVVKAGDERIDGVLFRFSKKELDQPILEIRLPEQGVAIIHHFFYNGMHSMIAANTEQMMAQLDAFKKENLNWIVAGHGVPGGPEIIDTQIQYQKKARAILNGAASVDDAKKAIMEAYPTYGVPFLLDISLPTAMPKKNS